MVGAACLGWGPAGCASAARPGSPAISPRPIVCDAAIPASEALTAPLVLVGEIHGSVEIPAAFGSLVCHALARRPHEAILVGLEIFSSAQGAIDAFLASDGGASARNALLEHEFWQREYQDGRSSRAMLALLDELRGYGAAGGKLHVRAIDPPRFESASDRDAAMASTLSAAMDALRPAQTLVLVGNVHSRTLEGYPWDAAAAFVSLGARLRATHPGLTALDIKAAGGTVWICRSADPKDCGVRDQRATSISGPTPRIELDRQPFAASGYSGTLMMGRLTASPPARTTARE
jgi:hypothetical protein